MAFILSFILATLTLVSWVSADCFSWGVDFVNNGGPYCVDTTKVGEYFSFGTEFWGCTADDTQGGVIPILVDPNTDDYYCSTIQTNPDHTEMTSTCNVAGEELLKSSMISGNYTVVIEGLTFAWQRVFSISAGPPAVYTSTPTVTFSLTESPTTTATVTSTAVLNTTLPAVTITVPSRTSTITKTSIPLLVTSTTTQLVTKTDLSRVLTETTTTLTVTTACATQTPKQDPPCIIHPRKARLAAALGFTFKSPVRRGRTSGFSSHRHELGPRDIVKRAADACTTTVLATSAVSTNVTSTLPISTELITATATSTATITPPVVTSYSGAARTTITVTLPIFTFKITSREYTTTTVTKTVTGTITSITKVPTPGVVCVPRK